MASYYCRGPADIQFAFMDLAQRTSSSTTSPSRSSYEASTQYMKEMKRGSIRFWLSTVHESLLMPGAGVVFAWDVPDRGGMVLRGG